ncbi:MAG TPA: hypothetical protein VG796_29045 [Verrucomicrobiales bacterium]|nr:hypothetical protein [Verrucomicrobiales bacterium]
MSETPSQESTARPWWVWLNVLGLDAVFTALLWMALYAYASGARLVRAEYVVLACAVWCVYAMDRILDGTMTGGLRGERHVFAARRWLPLTAAMLVAAGVCVWLLGWHIREIVSVWGFKVLIGIAIYFGITWLSRREWTGLVGAASLGGIIAVGLMQGAASGVIWVQIWRGALAGFILTVLYLSVRQPLAPAPWTLPRKLLGGWLFAMGTALAPYAHKEMPLELISSNDVLLFGAVCALNSLGIRLWEKSPRDFEHTLLEQLYPWMLLTVAAGAGMQWSIADIYSRPLIMATLIAALLLLVIHLLRRRIAVSVLRALADAAMIVAAASMLALIAFRS